MDVVVKNLEEHVHSPDFQEMLLYNGVEREMFPLHPRPSQEAKESMESIDD